MMNRMSPIPDFDSRPEAPLRLVDLSLVARAGAKGADMPAWAKGAGLPIAGTPNNAVRHPDGGLVARLAHGEVLLLGDPAKDNAWIDTTMANLGQDQDQDQDWGLCFTVPRFDSHCWFVVLGAHAPDMFAKVCGVDLRPGTVNNLAIAQTSVARINAIVVRDDDTFKDKCEFPSYHVLADWTSAKSLWDYLLDAMAEFDGGAVKYGDLASTKRS